LDQIHKRKNSFVSLSCVNGEIDDFQPKKKIKHE